ncbi:DUF6179 domain-containing protein [Eubacteriales bacterium OttesenSCG-928-N13]|nr:DUF6179 domain-containing protein [Eubacteriales bacterium OttesenSCG-928-N13]
MAYKTERYNSGDSSSIRVEKAQDIMTSILFTIGVALKTYPNPDDAVTALRQNPMGEIYGKGRKRIDTLIAEAKAIHTKLLHQLVDTRNHFYRDTFVGGILGFFKLYDPDYAAQEIHITADYPLFNPMPKLLGIEFIRAYVEAAYLENQFCCLFAAEDIHHLLSGYAEDYEGLLINIYEQILTAAIGCTIAGVDCSRLDVTVAGTQYLRQAFAARPKKEILATITNAADELNRRYHFSNGLARYIKSSLPLIASSIEVAAREHTLNRIFFTPAFPENNPQIIFSYGVKMDDEQYRKVIAEIMGCRYLQDKIAIIKEHIHSLSDLEDVLLDAKLTGEEIRSVLHELSLPEIAALSKKYYPMTDDGAFEWREQEQLLRMALQSYISALPEKQQILIKQASKALQEEQDG